MKFSWRKKSRWQRVWDPIAGRMQGKTFKVNGKALNVDTVAKPAGRVFGGLLAATVVSAVLSALRGQDGDD